MTERDPYPASPRHEAPQPPLDWREDTAPRSQSAHGSPFSGTGASAVGASGAAGGSDGPVGTGAHGQRGQDEQYYTSPQYSPSPVTVRRPDWLAALLLVLAGVAAGVSLLLDWYPRFSGWDLTERGFEGFGSGTWQPPVIVLAGGALLVLGLLMLLRARSHRTLGVLALLATMAAAGGVLVFLHIGGYDDLDSFETGFWFAVAVPVLGLLGSLKAMLTGPKVR